MAANSKPSQRLHFMDNLRALAMLLGVFFHAALAHSPMVRDQWLTASTYRSDVIDVFIWFTHLFRMPLFFLISGYFAHLLLEKRGVEGLVKNRASRILIPFLLFLPIVLGAVALTIIYNYKTLETHSPILSDVLSRHGSSPQSSLRTMHLWFLYYMLFFYIIAIPIYKSKTIERIKIIAKKHPLSILCCIPLILVPALLTAPLAHPAPEMFIPQFWVFQFYGLFFFCGFFIYKNWGVVTFIGRFAYPLLWIAIGLYIIFYFFFMDSLNIGIPLMPNKRGAVTFHSILAASLQAYIAVYLTLSILCIGKKHLNRTNKVLIHIANSSYWIYVTHLPILFFVQFKLQDLPLNLWANLLISSITTILIGLITYVLLVKPTPLNRLLNGKKKNLSKSQAPPSLLLNKQSSVEV